MEDKKGTTMGDKFDKVMHEPDTENTHIHNVEHVMKHYKAGGHMHESEKYRKHGAGHTLEHEKVKALTKRNGNRP